MEVTTHPGTCLVTIGSGSFCYYPAVVVLAVVLAQETMVAADVTVSG